MNKDEIINLINKYKLDKTKFIVISGAALTLHEIKKNANDIDIWCGKDYYNYLLDNYNCKYERTNEYGEKAYLIDNIINFGTSFKPKEIDIIEEIQVASLKDILELKIELNRDKDKKDIEILKNLIK